MKAKIVLFLFLTMSVFAYNHQTSQEFQVNEFGDVIYTSSRGGDSAKEALGAKSCGCNTYHPNTTLLGSCCWDHPAANRPTCYSAAGTGRSCITAAP